MIETNKRTNAVRMIEKHKRVFDCKEESSMEGGERRNMEYDCMRDLLPIWKGDTVRGEFIFVLENALGELRPFRLAYPVRDVLCVCSPDASKVYEEGRDYRINGYGELEIVREGRIPRILWKDYRLPAFDASRDDQMAAADALGAYRTGDLFADREGMRAYQLAVTYTHAESELYDIVPGKRERFARFLKKLTQEKKVTIASYGDSITYGWAASGMRDIRKPPFCKPYNEMMADYLRLRYGAEVTHVNCSVSGMCADWGAKDENVAGVIEAAPDLVILAFGMNDAGVFRPEDFLQNLRAIIRKVRNHCPETEFLLISPLLPNPLVAFTAGSSIFHYHAEYPRALRSLEQELSGVACADVTAMHALLLERKNLQDTISNNVNHPNDFMHRIYAQVALRTLLGKEF